MPLVIAGIPGLVPGDAGLVDIAPTLLRALGRDVADLDGRDLTQPAEAIPYRSHNPLYGDLDRSAVKRGDDKLLARGTQRMRFDLRRDPGEQTPLPVGEHEALARQLPPARLDATAPAPLPPETEAALRALGYAEPRPREPAR